MRACLVCRPHFIRNWRLCAEATAAHLYLGVPNCRLRPFPDVPILIKRAERTRRRRKGTDGNQKAAISSRSTIQEVIGPIGSRGGKHVRGTGVALRCILPVPRVLRTALEIRRLVPLIVVGN